MMQQIHKLWWCMALMGLFWITSASHAHSKTHFSLGWDTWTPYFFVDESGQVTGLDIELVTSIMENAGLQISLHNMSWIRHLKEVELGRVDIASSAGKSPEREAYANFSDPYRWESASLFVKKGAVERFQFDNMTTMLQNSFTLGIVTGFYYGEEIAALLEDPVLSQMIQIVNSDEMNIKKLQADRIDGFLLDSMVAAQLFKQKGLQDVFEKHPVLVYREPIHVMFSKASTTLDHVDAFNQSLQILRDNGEYERILSNYLE